MNTHRMKWSLLLVLLYVLLSATHTRAQQGVTVTVRALQDTHAVTLDSILIVNQRNNTELKLAGLPATTTDYVVDLLKGTLQSSTDAPALTATQPFAVRVATTGYSLHVNRVVAGTVLVNLYNLDGKCCNTRTLHCSAGLSDHRLEAPAAGLYLLHVQASDADQTFKLVFGTRGSLTSATEAAPVQQVVRRVVATSNWDYIPGDRIQVLVRKASLRSLAWWGKPLNGNLIQLALPKNSAVFDMKQTLSGGAQINTISFSGVAFYSGCFYASSFYPPGKVADYFGFQYLRDNDPDESGHNTDFLTKAAYHMMHILTDAQLQKLIDLAVKQDSLFSNYALDRLVLIKAFHRYLDGDIPAGKTTLNADSVKMLSRRLYLTDAQISYGRAQCFAEIIRSLTEEQRDTLYRLGAVGMQVWPMPAKPTVTIPHGLNTWVMSNASEMFSWFLRGVDADIYFCPERQGTYFGGFFMKDAPAVGNAGYGIDMQATANKGSFMLDSILTPAQSTEIKKIYTQVGPALAGIVQCRTLISTELRKALVGEAVSGADIDKWSAQYGDYDGTYIYSMVDQFVKVARTLTPEQKVRLHKLRDLDAYPCKDGKVYLYSAEIDEPAIRNTDFLFK